MILRLHFYSLSLKVATYLLPTLAFILGGWIWLALCLTIHRSSPYSPHDHFGYVLFGTFVWAFYARHYRVTNFDEIFRERTGAKAAGSACIATTFILLATLYFGRNQAFPRGLLVCDIVSLMLLTVVVHAAFRILCRSRAQLAKPVRLLIIGADEFAKSASTRLQRLAFAPCEIGGFVRLPGQETTRANQPIFEMQQLENLNSGHGFDEAVIALHPTGFSQVPQIMVALNHLCLPTSAIVDFGEGVVVRDQLFQ